MKTLAEGIKKIRIAEPPFSDENYSSLFLFAKARGGSAYIGGCHGC